MPPRCRAALPPRLQPDCYDGFVNYCSAFMFGIETMFTIGYGARVTNECWMPASLVGLNCIYGLLLQVGVGGVGVGGGVGWGVGGVGVGWAAAGCVAESHVLAVSSLRPGGASGGLVLPANLVAAPAGASPHTCVP
jgi:hypothetical protein